jgi:dienelactone hydrolase
MVETVVFPTLSGSAQGQFAAPAAPGPGLLLLPEVNGLAPWLLARAERLAGAGVWTLVVDLLGGQGTWSDGVEDNASRFLALDLAEVAHDINGAARFLLDQPQVTGDTVAVSGDDGGGALALWAATVSPRIGAASAVYPARILWRFEGIRPEALAGGDTVLHLAADDPDFGPADTPTAPAQRGRRRAPDGPHLPRDPAGVPERVKSGPLRRRRHRAGVGADQSHGHSVGSRQGGGPMTRRDDTIGGARWMRPTTPGRP